MSATRESWQSEVGASAQALNSLKAAVGNSLPEAYLALLTQGNGGEVPLSVFPHNFCLDSAESALDYFESGTYTLQGVFVFGGDGGGSLLALDVRQAKPWPVICFDPIDPEGSIETISDDFNSFLGLIARDQA
jgi:SMI1-KNR4 cell-wall